MQDHYFYKVKLLNPQQVLSKNIIFNQFFITYLQLPSSKCKEIIERNQFISELKLLLTKRGRISFGYCRQVEEIKNFIKKYSNFYNVLSQVNPNLQNKLIKKMQLVEYAEKGVLFRKGDVADYFYILISGEVIIYDDVCSLVDFSESFEIKEKIMNRLLPVSQFGEKAFEYKQNKRTMNAKFSSQNNILIRVDGKDYIKFLQVENQRQREIMIKNLDYCLPRFKESIRSVKEKNIYYFKSWRFSRGFKIIRQRMKVDQLYFIVNGECLICSESKDGSKVIQLTILCSGAFFGEESVFFGKHSSYDVIVKSDCCEAISIKQEDLLNLPQNVYQELLDQVKVKSILRTFAKKKQALRQNKQEKKQPQQLKHITRGTMQLSTQIISSNIRKTLDRLITNEQKISQESKHFQQTHKNLASARGETAKHFEFPKLKKSWRIDFGEKSNLQSSRMTTIASPKHKLKNMLSQDYLTSIEESSKQIKHLKAVSLFDKPEYLCTL